MKMSLVLTFCLVTNLLLGASASAAPKIPKLEVEGGTITLPTPSVFGTHNATSCPPVIAQAQAFCQPNKLECEKTAAFLNALTSPQVKVSSYCHPAQDQCNGQGYVVRTLIIPDMSPYSCQ